MNDGLRALPWLSLCPSLLIQMTLVLCHSDITAGMVAHRMAANGCFLWAPRGHWCPHWPTYLKLGGFQFPTQRNCSRKQQAHPSLNGQLPFAGCRKTRGFRTPDLHLIRTSLTLSIPALSSPCPFFEVTANCCWIPTLIGVLILLKCPKGGEEGESVAPT